MWCVLPDLMQWIYMHIQISFTKNIYIYIYFTYAAAAKLRQLCPTLCDPIDGSPPGSAVPGFSRQEHWSGLPFPSPMLESESESEVAQSCPAISDPMDCSLPGSSIHGIFQIRVLEWVAISFSNAWKWKVKVKSLSRVWLLATLWTVAYQAPPSMGFSRQEYWSGVPLPSPIFYT